MIQKTINENKRQRCSMWLVTLFGTLRQTPSLQWDLCKGRTNGQLWKYRTAPTPEPLELATAIRSPRCCVCAKWSRAARGADSRYRRRSHGGSYAAASSRRCTCPLTGRRTASATPWTSDLSRRNLAVAPLKTQQHNPLRNAIGPGCCRIRKHLTSGCWPRT